MSTPDVLHLGGKHGPAPLVAGTAVWNGLAWSPYLAWALKRGEARPYAATPFLAGNGSRITLAHVRSLPPTETGATRLATIARRLLGELLPLLRGVPAGPVGLCVALPERFGDGADHKAFRPQRTVLERALTGAVEAAGRSALLRTFPSGPAGLAPALVEAVHALASRKLEVVLVGGLDTGYDPEVLEALDRDGRLFDGERVEGVVLGEGGAFLLLARRDLVRQLKLPQLATIESIAEGREPATPWNDVGCLGLGLSRPACAVRERLLAERRGIDLWITDATSEPLRTQEFQLAWPRAAEAAMRPTATLDYMYPTFGDLGAAVMPTSVALAIEGMRRGAPVARSAVVTGSSDGGARGVVLVAAEAAE